MALILIFQPESNHFNTWYSSYTCNINVIPHAYSPSPFSWSCLVSSWTSLTSPGVSAAAVQCGPAWGRGTSSWPPISPSPPGPPPPGSDDSAPSLQPLSYLLHLLHPLRNINRWNYDSHDSFGPTLVSRTWPLPTTYAFLSINCYVATFTLVYAITIEFFPGLIFLPWVFLVVNTPLPTAAACRLVAVAGGKWLGCLYWSCWSGRFCKRHSLSRWWVRNASWFCEN